MKFWRCYTCIIMIQITIIVTVLYNLTVYQQESGPQAVEVKDVYYEGKGLSLPQACEAALDGKTVQMWSGELTTTFGIDSCPYYVIENHYITAPLSVEEILFPLAYVMTISEDFATFERFFRAIYMPQNIYCIHIDKAATFEFRNSVQELLSCFSNAFLSSQSEYVFPGHTSRLHANLDCMRDLIESEVQWRYVINTCDHDFPLKTNREIVHYLKTLHGKNLTPNLLSVLTFGKKIKYAHGECRTEAKSFVLRRRRKKKPPPNQLRIYFGSVYFALTWKFVHFALFNKKAIELLHWSQDMEAPDEYFWITLNKIPDAPGSMTQKTSAASLRAVKWIFQENIHEGCHGHYLEGMCVYGPGDLKWLYRSPSMFANKVELEKYPLAVECLELKIRERTLNGSEISVKPDWYLIPN